MYDASRGSFTGEQGILPIERSVCLFGVRLFTLSCLGSVLGGKNHMSLGAQLTASLRESRFCAGASLELARVCKPAVVAFQGSLLFVCCLIVVQ